MENRAKMSVNEQQFMLDSTVLAFLDCRDLQTLVKKSNKKDELLNKC